jgi:hypothetical protein
MHMPLELKRCVERRVEVNDEPPQGALRIFHDLEIVRRDNSQRHQHRNRLMAVKRLGQFADQAPDFHLQGHGVLVIDWLCLHFRAPEGFLRSSGVFALFGKIAN